MSHFLLFPSLKSNRTVNLSCAVRPGALPEKYEVVWEEIPSRIFGESFFDLQEVVKMDQTRVSEYRCRVKIEHDDGKIEYIPPDVVVNKKGKSHYFFSVFDSIFHRCLCSAVNSGR